jgi:ABC-2 type transport system ATP-binding protein
VLTSPVPELVEEIADRIVVVRHGEVAAFDNLEGLRRLTQVSGSLSDILEKLIYPETTRKLQDYFKELPS